MWDFGIGWAGQARETDRVRWLEELRCYFDVAIWLPGKQVNYEDDYELATIGAAPLASCVDVLGPGLAGEEDRADSGIDGGELRCVENFKNMDLIS